MFQKKTFTLVEEKKEKKMYTVKNVKWVNYLIVLALIAFVLLLILANVKSKSYYRDLNLSMKISPYEKSRSIYLLDDMSTRAIACETKSCVATCTGDMTNLNKYLDTQKSCSSIKLQISDFSFPDDRLQSNWLDGSFNLSSIQITQGTLSGIDSGAFNQKTVAYVTHLVLNVKELQNLTENTFMGLNAMQELTLTNTVEAFTSDTFLKPMVKTLLKITIKIVSSTVTDPEPWLRGGSFPNLQTIVFDNNNFGGNIRTATFSHLERLNVLSIQSCKMDSIEDGAFDFITKHFVGYICLAGNRLTRIDGYYLTKTTSLLRVDMQNNPWDCTCKLENFITQYKRSPDSFGENTKCSTPAEYAGKVLSATNVEPCEDTTTALTTTPSTTTSTLSSSSTEDVTNPITPLPTEPSTSPSSTSTDPITTPSTEPSTSTSTTSTYPVTTSSTSPSTRPSDSTTTPTEILSDTTLSTLNFETSTSPTPDPVTSLSTTPSSSTYSTTISPTTTTEAAVTTLYTPDPETPTTALTTVGDNAITSPPPLTTPSPQNRTTTVSAGNTIFIECQRYTVQTSAYVNSPEFFVELSPPEIYFDILQLSRTSAELKIENPTEDLALIWFYDQPDTTGSGENIQIVGEFNVGCQSELENSLVIEGLALKRAYTFCIVKEGVQVISPFNCRSFYTTEETNGGVAESEVWLKFEDKALTIGLFIFGIIISFCIGVVGMFVLLRFRPALLKGSKRVIIVNRSTGDVLIMPPPVGKPSMTESSYRNSYETNTTVPPRRFSDTSIQSGRSYMMANNYEDIEYRWKMNVVNDLIYANRVPKSPPPPLPKKAFQNLCLNKEIADKMKVAVVLPKGNDYGYIP